MSQVCLLQLLQADSQSGGAAPTVTTARLPHSTGRESDRAAVRDAGLEFPIGLGPSVHVPMGRGERGEDAPKARRSSRGPRRPRGPAFGSGDRTAGSAAHVSRSRLSQRPGPSAFSNHSAAVIAACHTSRPRCSLRGRTGPPGQRSTDATSRAFDRASEGAMDGPSDDAVGPSRHPPGLGHHRTQPHLLSPIGEGPSRSTLGARSRYSITDFRITRPHAAAILCPEEAAPTGHSPACRRPPSSR